MKYILLIVFLCTFFSASSMRRSYSEMKDKERLELLNKIVKDNIQNKRVLPLLKMINNSTRLIRFYSFILDTDTFDYTKSVTANFIDLGGETYLLVNRDSVFAIAGRSSSERFILSGLMEKDKGIFSAYKSIASKVDLKKSFLFILDASPEVYVMISGKCYIIKDGQLHYFNDYYKERYSLEEFKELFNPIIK